MKRDEQSVTYEGVADFEKALLEAQTEASLDGILVASAEGTILSFNSRFAEMWGIPQEVLDEGDDDNSRRLVMDQLIDPSGFMERIRHLYDNPTESSVEELRLKDGRIFDRFSRPILRPDTGTFGRVWFFRDVTEQRRAAARLHAQYEVTRVVAEAHSLESGASDLLRGIAESLGWEFAALWLVEDDDSHLHCRATWTAAGLSLEEFRDASQAKSLSLNEGVPGTIWESGEPLWVEDVTLDDRFVRTEAAVTAGLHSALAFPILIGTETVGVIEAFTRELREPDADLLETLASLGRQIGQFVARRRVEEAVVASEARKTAMLESALDCIITMDHRGNVVDFNPSAEETFGYKRAEVVGKEMASLIIPEELRDKHREGLARYLETGEGPILGTRIEVNALRADGTQIPVELAIAPVDVVGAPMFTGYLRDITSRRDAERERAQLLENERKARADSELAHRRLAYLAEVSRVLATSLDYRKTLQQVARLAVPQLADWCAIYEAQSPNPTKPLVVAHVDPAQVELAKQYYERYPTDPNAETGTPNVMRTGRSELIPLIPQELIDTTVTDPVQRAMVNALKIRSYMIVPLIARGRTLGAITFVSSREDRLFGEEDLSFAELVARRAAMAVDNARLYEQQVAVARTLQRSLLPPTLPEIPGVDLATLYEPAVEENEVGGDFYDIFPLGGNEWAIVVGDVCGKGTEAAAITGLARHTIRAVAMRESDPTKLLETLNEAMVRQPSDERFVTVAIARLRVFEQGAQIEVACGGHPEPYLLKANGDVEKLGEAGTVIGLFTGIEINPRVAALEPGDSVVFYTDGVTEARGETRIFGGYRLRQSLGECRDCDSEHIVQHIRDSVENFRTRAARDDMAIVAIRIKD